MINYYCAICNKYIICTPRYWDKHLLSCGVLMREYAAADIEFNNIRCITLEEYNNAMNEKVNNKMAARNYTIPTIAEMVEEQLEDVATRTVEDLDERLFYVADKYTTNMSSEEFAEFVKRAVKGLEKALIEKVKEWDGPSESDD